MDTVITIGRSRLQAGADNDRIYLMDYHRQDHQSLINKINELQDKHHYGKHFFKIPDSAAPVFLSRGYRMEALIPGYYHGKEDALLLTRYFDQTRQVMSPDDKQALETLIPESMAPKAPSPQEKNIRPAVKEDAPALAELYAATFDSYPFPIDDPGYIRRTMEEGVDYFVIDSPEQPGKLGAASSAEKNNSHKNAEMTDFAVAPEFRGQRLALSLLRKMEAHLRRENYHCLYTIARLSQPGMNRTFIAAGYRYSGTLINNTQIGGSLESMNVWYKGIQ